MKPSLMLIARSKPVLFVRIRPIWSETGTFCPDPVLLVRIRSFLSKTGPFGPDTAHFVRNRSFLSGSGPFCPDPAHFVRNQSFLSETSPFCPVRPIWSGPDPAHFVHIGSFCPSFFLYPVLCPDKALLARIRFFWSRSGPFVRILSLLTGSVLVLCVD